MIASPEQIAKIRANYELLIDNYSEERTRYNYFMENLEEIDKALAVAFDVLKRVRQKLGY